MKLPSLNTSLTAVAVAAVALTLVACGKKGGDGPQVIKIGHVGPTSGAIAHLGKDNENGAKMAIEELNAAGIKIGDKVVKFELLAEDDAADPKQGTAAAQKLVDAKVQGVIGHLNSGTTIPASQLYNAAGIPQISPSATNPKYTRQGYAGAFRVVADDVHLGGTLGKYAVETLKGKNIAVIDDRTAYGQGVAEEFEKAVKAAGGNLVGHEFTTDKASDFNAILTTLKGKKPDVVFFGGMDAVAGPMLKQMKQLGINAKFMGSVQLSWPNWLPKAWLTKTSTALKRVVLKANKKPVWKNSVLTSKPSTTLKCKFMHLTYMTQSKSWPRLWSLQVLQIQPSICQH
jgi:branched-chain amino acid transport system substrate-binding protein